MPDNTNEAAPKAGEMHPVDKAFYELAIKERNHAWEESARHKRERDEALDHQHQEGTGVGEAGCERCEHYRRALSRVNGHIGISPTCGGSQSGVTLYGAEGITPDEAEQVGGLMQEAFARSAKPPCGTCEGTGQLTPPEGVGPLLPCPTCTTEKQGEAERPRRVRILSDEELAELYPDLDFGYIAKRTKELRACESDAEAIALVLAPQPSEGEVRRLRGRLKQIALYMGWDRSDAWKVETARLTAQNALDESPATQPTPSVDEGDERIGRIIWAAAALLSERIGTTREGRGWLPDRETTRQALDRLQEALDAAATQQPAEPTNGEAG